MSEKKKNAPAVCVKSLPNTDMKSVDIFISENSLWDALSRTQPGGKGLTDEVYLNLRGSGDNLI